MRLDDIIKAADKAYPDGLVGKAYREIKAKKDSAVLTVGDTLAEFIAREITETYDPKAGTDRQLEEAAHVMETALSEVQNVWQSLKLEHEFALNETKNGKRGRK